MSATALGQVIRNAIEAERAAARFYEALAAGTDDDAAKQFLARMAHEEQQHAATIAEMGSRLEAGELPASAEMSCELVETAPGWRGVEEIEIDAALQVALEAEVHAALYYDAVADSVPPGPIRDLFQAIARTEEQHIKRVQVQIDARARSAHRRR